LLGLPTAEEQEEEGLMEAIAILGPQIGIAASCVALSINRAGIYRGAYPFGAPSLVHVSGETSCAATAGIQR
jgi:hypothetical protein